MIVVAVIVVVVGIIVGICYPRFKMMQKLTDELNTATRENITGVRVVRAFNAEDYQTSKFEAVNEKVKRNQLFTARGMGLMMPVIQMCMNGLTLAVYWIGAALINNAAGIPERLELLGNMAVFTQYAIQVIMAFMLLIMIFMILPRCLVSGKRIADVLGTHRSVRSGALKQIDREDGVPVIEFKGVEFAYDHAEGKVVSDIDFTIERGSTVAIIGATGSGKTTLINLIERFYDADGGEVLFNGVNVKEYDEEVLRGSIALVSAAVLFIGVLVMMFKVNAVLAVTTIGSSLLGFVCMAVILKASQKHFDAKQEQLGEMNGQIEEIYTQHNTVKAYNGKHAARARFWSVNDRLYDSNRKSQFLSGMMMPVMGFVGNLSYVLIFVVGVAFIVGGNTTVTIGTLLAFVIFARCSLNR